MAFRIRAAEEKDMDDCASIVCDEFNKLGEGFTKGTAMGRVRELFDMGPDICFCLEEDGRVIGLLFCERFKYAKGQYMWISEFAIREGYRGKGYGGKALEFIQKAAKDKGIDVLSLFTDVKGDAVKIYGKYGFKMTDYVMMEKDLKRGPNPKA
ncbi:MAG: hypothetical protein DRO99_00210 [Candidatus Aenigmatarchaeota archaeon]|nr:MAG: hypothetical protein DRO99_00210 [Candidatus Aenigmarchaeota archaeon]